MDWRIATFAGVVLIYAGNVLLNRAVEEFERSRMEKRLSEDASWADASRMPHLIRRKPKTADDEDKADDNAASPRE